METLQIEKTKKLVPELRFKGFDGIHKVIRFGDVVESNIYGPRFNANDYSEVGNVKTIRGTDLGSDGEIKYDQVPLALLDEKMVKTHKLLEGDIVMITTAECGATGVYRKQNVDYLSSAYGVRIRLNEFGFPYYFKFFFQTYQAKKEINSYIRKSTIANLPGSDILRIKLNIPSLPEQQKIASFLSSVDEKIQQLTRKKELLEQYKKGVMQQLFSGKLRFKDENGEEYPEWEEKRLGEISTNISYGMNAAATKYDGVNKYLRITDIDESSDGLNLDKFTSPDGKLEDKFRVKVGDLLFARTGASVGKTYLYRNSDGVLYFAGFLIRFHIKDAIPAFVYLNTQTSKYNKWIKVMSMRSGQPGINAEEYKSFQIKLPCLEEQQKIVSFLSNIDSKIESTTQQINQTQTFKKGLLQKMFV
jgi:type I restriction enzyme S subunit